MANALNDLKMARFALALAKPEDRPYWLAVKAKALAIIAWGE